MRRRVGRVHRNPGPPPVARNRWSASLIESGDGEGSGDWWRLPAHQTRRTRRWAQGCSTLIDRIRWPRPVFRVSGAPPRPLHRQGDRGTGAIRPSPGRHSPIPADAASPVATTALPAAGSVGFEAPPAGSESTPSGRLADAAPSVTSPPRAYCTGCAPRPPCPKRRPGVAGGGPPAVVRRTRAALSPSTVIVPRPLHAVVSPSTRTLHVVGERVSLTAVLVLPWHLVRNVWNARVDSSREVAGKSDLRYQR